MSCCKFLILAPTISFYSFLVNADSAQCNSQACTPSLVTDTDSHTVLSPLRDTNNNTVASNNTVIIEAIPTGLVIERIYAAYRTDAVATNNNTIEISNVSMEHGLGLIRGAYSQSGDANYNTVKLTNTAIPNGGSVVAGTAASDGNAINNIITIRGESVVNDSVIGGYSRNGTAIGNTVDINGGVVMANSNAYAAGGVGSHLIKDNKLIITNGKHVETVFGGYGFHNVEISDNTVIIDNTIIPYAWGVGGGFIDGSGGNGDIFNNSISIHNTSISHDVFGGRDKGGQNNIYENKVTITNSIINGSVTGGENFYGSARGNIVNIIDSKVSAVAGGVVFEGGSVTKNEVLIIDGNISGNIIGGQLFDLYDQSLANSAVDNTITIKGKPTFNVDSSLLGGDCHQCNLQYVTDLKSGNTLSLHIDDIKIKNLKNFESLFFYIQHDTDSGATLATLNDASGTDVSNTTIGVCIEEDSDLLVGDHITLLKAVSLQTDAVLINDTTKMTDCSAITQYEFSLSKVGSSLIATITDITQLKVGPILEDSFEK